MPTMTNNNVRVQSAVAYALAQIGKPYVWASAGPNSFDCSGLVWRAFEAAGYKFQGRPTTYSLIGMGSPVVNKADLQPGDLVFPDPGHVQIYYGNGLIIEAPHTGARVRKVPMWGFWRARRLINNNVSETDSADGNDPSVGNSAGKDTDTQLESLAGLLGFLTNSHNWIRILMIILGVIMILIAAGRMAGDEVYELVGSG